MITPRISLCLLLFALATPINEACGEETHLWVYAPVNFQVNESTDELLALLKRAKAAGYNGAVVTDYKFGRIEGRPQRYYDNLERTRAAADKLGIELIPCVMPIGYSNSILQNNPNLAAGLPVKDCRFVVKDGRAVAAAENLTPGGDFEEADKRRPAGWDWIDGFGTSTALDMKTRHGGASSLVMRNFRAGNEHGNCRVVKKLKLRPWHQYRVTLWIKTDGLARAGEFQVNPLAGGRRLNYARLGVKPTQDWTRHRVVFNSLEHEDVSLYIGLWGGTEGTVWIDDVALQIVGGVNLLRREGCPLRVASADGKIEYTEGGDFQPWADPHLGRKPYAGEFSDDHEPPPLVLAENTRMRPGQELSVSFYHTVIIYDGQVSSVMVDDELFAHLRRQVEQVHKYLRPKRYFMQHDELRVGGYDAAEVASGKTSGELLAENARRCVQIIKDVSPPAEVLVWSDMFDPHHNARDNYYLVRGTLKESWRGLDPAVAIVNWNGGRARESLQFFSARGHRQIIAGYYDGDVRGNFQRWRDASGGVDGIRGWMYTTWRRNYRGLEAFAELAR